MSKKKKKIEEVISQTIDKLYAEKNWLETKLGDETEPLELSDLKQHIEQLNKDIDDLENKLII